MKSIATVIFLLIAEIGFAQRPYGMFQPISNPVINSSLQRDEIDTIRPISFIPQNDGGLGCFTGIYPAPDSGYVTGNNKYGDLQKTQFFSLSEMGYGDTGTIESVLVEFGLKTLNATPEDIYVQVYNVDTGGFQPWQVLATSNPVNLANINTAGFATTFTFASPVAVSDSFFVSVVLPLLSGDTVALISSYNDCKGVTGWSWELWSNGTWHTIVNSWILDIDLAIFPVMDLPINTGIETASVIDGQNQLYPNPTAGITTFNYFVHASNEVEILLIDEQGSVIRRIDKGLLHEGFYSETLNLENLPAGFYHVMLRAGTMQDALPLSIER